MSAYGLSPWGTGPLGGPGQIGVRGAVATGQRTILVEFDLPPLMAPFRQGNAITGSNWSLAARAEVGDPAVERVPSVIVGRGTPDPTKIELSTDFPMLFGVPFVLTAHPVLRGAACEEYAGETDFEVLAPRRSRYRPSTSTRQERYRDLDWRGSQLHTTPAGDIAIQSGRESLRQRLFRRITTAFGSYVFMTAEYGVRLRIKELVSRTSVQQMANDIASQVRREPDIIEATATVQLVGSVVWVDIQGRSRYEQVDERFAFDPAQ